MVDGGANELIRGVDTTWLVHEYLFCFITMVMCELYMKEQCLTLVAICMWKYERFE